MPNASPNRIRLRDCVIYCTSQIIRETREMTIKLEQVYAPKRGMTDKLESKLRKLASEHPRAFTKNSLHILGVRE